MHFLINYILVRISQMYIGHAKMFTVILCMYNDKPPSWGVSVQCINWIVHCKCFVVPYLMFWYNNYSPLPTEKKIGPTPAVCWEVRTFFSLLFTCIFFALYNKVFALFFIVECFVYNDRPITKKENLPTTKADSTTADK